MKFHALVVVLTVGANAVLADISWSYSGETGPDFWPFLKLGGQNQCGLSAQSPIDIDVLTTKYDPSMKPLSMKNYDRITSNVTIVNNGHSIQLNSPDWKQITSGGPLSGSFKLLQMHFHWGKDSYRGSEHTVNGKRYPLELHMVHSQVPEANKAASGALAVIGIFFDITKGESNIGVQKITQAIKDMKTHDAVDVPSDLSPIMFLPSSKNFFTYQGSLTTPPCSEVVTWVVLREPLKVNEKDLALFRSTFFEDNTAMVDNFRPVQARNDREVRTSFTNGSASVMLSSLPLLIMSTLLSNRWSFK